MINGLKFAVLLVALLLLGLTECANSHKKYERPSVNTTITKNSTRSQQQSSQVATPTPLKDNFYELNNKMLPSAKLARSKRQTRVLRERPRSRKLGRRRPPPPFLPPRLPPIARRRFPKRPGKSKYHHPKPGKLLPQYGPPVGFFVMNLNNEIVHKSKDLGDIPPQYLDKIIPPNFISDSPPKIYAVEHDDEAPPLALGESKEVGYTPTNSYGVPVQPQHLDPQQYYPYPPAPAIEHSETRTQINTFNRGQSETPQYPDQPPPIVYHPPFKKNNNNSNKNQKPKKRKKKLPQIQQHHTEFALEPDSPKNTYPISSYEVPLNYVPQQESSSSAENSYPLQPHHQQQVPQQKQRPMFNVGQSFVESYSRETSSSNERPPQLPAKYNQNDFNTVNKSNNKKKLVYKVNTSYENLDDADHGLALDYPPSSWEEEDITEAPTFNFGARQRKKRPQKYDFIDSYEDSSISQEVYHTTPFLVTRPIKKSPATPAPTTKHYFRTRGTTKDPLIDILDTEELRTAFNSGRHNYKIQQAKKGREQDPPNFVLLSSKNPTYKSSTKQPFIVAVESGEDFKPSNSKGVGGFEQPPSSLETDYESYELAERDFGLRKTFTHKQRKPPQRKDSSATRMDSSVEKIQFSDGRRRDDGEIKATTMKPYPRFNPDVQFTKTFSSKIEQPRNHETSLWNGHPIPGNHKIARRGGNGGNVQQQQQ